MAIQFSGFFFYRAFVCASGQVMVIFHMKEDKSKSHKLCCTANVSEIKLYANFPGFIGLDTLLNF